MPAIDRFIHVPHIVCCDFAGESLSASRICGQRWRDSVRTSGTA